MGSFATTPFGIGTFGIQPFAQQQYPQQFSTQAIGSFGPGGAQLWPHTVQLLQVVTQQLQQLQQTVPSYLQYMQQQLQPFGSTISGPFGLVPSQLTSQSAGHVM